MGAQRQRPGLHLRLTDRRPATRGGARPDERRGLTPRTPGWRTTASGGSTAASPPSARPRSPSTCRPTRTSFSTGASGDARDARSPGRRASPADGIGPWAYAVLDGSTSERRSRSPDGRPHDYVLAWAIWRFRNSPAGSEAREPPEGHLRHGALLLELPQLGRVAAEADLEPGHAAPEEHPGHDPAVVLEPSAADQPGGPARASATASAPA